MTIRVMIADDHAVIRDGLKFMLEAQGDISVVGVAGNGRQAVQLVRDLQPDIVIMDIAMPELNGIDAAQQIRELEPHTQIVILSMYATKEHIFRALQAGAAGYLLKETAGMEVVNAVRTAFAGRHYLSQQISDTLITEFVQMRNEMLEKSPLDRLSLREREVLQLVVEGKSSAQIASVLALSTKSVETYRSRLMAKLGVTDLPGLVKFAIQYGLITLK